MPSETVRFPAPGGGELVGSLVLPDGVVRGAALFAHCFTCTRSSKAAVRVSEALASEGIACLRFDFTGLGDSDGEFGRDGLAGDVDDLVAAAGYLARRFERRLLLVGHSLGGAAVLAAADDLGSGRVAAIATIAAPSDAAHAIARIAGDLAAIERDGKGAVSIGGRPFTIRRTFLEQLRQAELRSQVASLGAPLMILHSPTDTLVGIEHAAALFAAARHPKSFVSLDGADHLLLREADALFAAQVIAAWSSRYLGEA